MLHVIVADKKVVRILGLDFDGALREVELLTNPAAVAHERDLVADRPGRMINVASGAHTALGPTSSARAVSLQRWIKAAAAHLRALVRGAESEGLVLIATPRLLALLRTALASDVKRHVLLEIPRDLAKLPLVKLQNRLNPQVRAAVKRARHSPSPLHHSTFRAGD